MEGKSPTLIKSKTSFLEIVSKEKFFVSKLFFNLFKDFFIFKIYVSCWLAQIYAFSNICEIFVKGVRNVFLSLRASFFLLLKQCCWWSYICQWKKVYLLSRIFCYQLFHLSFKECLCSLHQYIRADTTLSLIILRVFRRYFLAKCIS